ncbi:MAG: hypothetical protein RR162_08310 [Oscillospiraceae bacterium]
MDFFSRVKAAVETRQISPVDHFSIEKIGSKFYLYAHSFENDGNKTTVGRYDSYEKAKLAVDTVLDLRLESYGT